MDIYEPRHVLTQGHTEMHTRREPRVHTQQCVNSHWSAYLKGLGLEAGGLPEDTDHLPTMLVIEEKRQISKGLLEGTEHKRDYNRHLGPPPWFQLHGTLSRPISPLELTLSSAR